MGFRIVCIGAGLFFLRSFIFRFSHLFAASMHRNHGATFNDYLSWYSYPILLLVVAIYLLCGAPHFVRWQVKKTLAICEKESTG